MPRLTVTSYVAFEGVFLLYKVRLPTKAFMEVLVRKSCYWLMKVFHSNFLDGSLIRKILYAIELIWEWFTYNKVYDGGKSLDLCQLGYIFKDVL